MKTKQLLLSLIAVVIVGGTSFFMLNDVNNDVDAHKYQVRDENNLEKIQKSARDAADWINARRVNPITGKISSKDLERAKLSFEQNELNRSSKGGSQNWTFMGPNNVAGRTRAFLVDNQDKTTLWAGGVSGGLWKSVNDGQSWDPIDRENIENVSISTICQTPDGTIYFGTGEVEGTGFRGEGIYKSDVSKQTFTRLAETADGSKFGFVNELVSDKNGVLYAACQSDNQGVSGIWKSTDKGEHWTKPFTSGVGRAIDVAVTSKGTVVFVMKTYGTGGTKSTVYVSKDGAQASSKLSDFAAGIDAGDTYDRIELAVSENYPDYMYALCSYGHQVNDKWFNLFRSRDGGDTWTSVLNQYTSSVSPFGDNKQGYYDNVIAIYPDDPDRVVFGGIDLWEWTPGNAFEQVSYWIESAGSKFVHADQHAIVFHPDFTENNKIYFGNDGGIFLGQRTAFFKAINKNLNITQFYAIDCGPKGEALGGTQDNGSQYINLAMDINIESSVEVSGGDGGYSAISELYPGAIFSTLYYSQLFRSNEHVAAATLQRNPFDRETKDLNLLPGNKRNPFITPIDMWESFNYEENKMYIQYVVAPIITIGNDGVPDTTKEFKEGDILFIQSSVVEPRKFEYKITAQDLIDDINDSEITTIEVGDTLAIRERFSTLMAIGGAGNNSTSDKLFITREMLNFKDAQPKWDAIYGSNSGMNVDLNISKVNTVKWAPDGANLYVLADATTGGGLYRFSGIDEYFHVTKRVNGNLTDVEVPTYSNRVISSDTTLKVYKHLFFECDTVVTEHIKISDVDFVNTYDSTYMYQELSTGFLTGSVTYSHIKPMADNTTFFDTSNTYLLNLISLTTTTCDTAKNIESFAITASGLASLDVDYTTIYTPSNTYEDVVFIDTVAISGEDTTLSIISQITYNGQFSLDTITPVNNDSITDIQVATIALETKTITVNSNVYENVVRIDTITVKDTLIDFTARIIADGFCNYTLFQDINIDTVSNVVSHNETVDYFDLNLKNSTVIDFLIKIDTITTPDTTYQMGIAGNDMVWHNQVVNTVDSIKGMKIKSFNGGMPTSISVDPKKTDIMIVTVGGFGTHSRVFYTENATADSPTFIAIDGSGTTGLPEAPVYASLISDTVSSGDDNLIIVGTEYGIYSCKKADAGSTVWVRETAIPRTAVYNLTQQLQPNGYLPDVCNTSVTNSGVIYAGTHGLGIWKMDLYARPYTSVEEIQTAKVDALSVKIYPNPVRSLANVEYNITETSNVEITVYSLTGKLVYKEVLSNQYKGKYLHSIDASSFDTGVYVISLTSNDERKVSKFIVE